MGRSVLLAALALSALQAVGCDSPPGREPGDPLHPNLACRACHDGGLSDRAMPATSTGACTANGCHAEGGPGTIVVAGTPIPHRAHGDTAVARPACAGCHTHGGGGQPLVARTDACFLCHSGRLVGDDPQDCMYCHRQPQHVALASQGTPLPHSGVPWVEATCVRCHYDVSRGTTHVDLATCSACHSDTQRAARLGAGTDLHPIHDGLSCTQCHGSDQHRIEAMSSAVDLQCSDCHAVDHGIDVDPAWDDADGCNTCHEEVHQAQQSLFLGYVPGRAISQPSFKFLEGMTCRSCHTSALGGPAPVAASTPDDHLPATRGVPASCGACHRPEYARIPAWWSLGGRQRVAAVDRYLGQAERELGPSAPDTARLLLGRARTVVDLVDEGGVQHNIELADRILRESLDHIGLAYRLSARFPPAAPDLGTPARRWFCSSCHYPIGQPAITSSMPTEPHEELRRKLERQWVDPGTEPPFPPI